MTSEIASKEGRAKQPPKCKENENQCSFCLPKSTDCCSASIRVVQMPLDNSQAEISCCWAKL